MVVHSWVFLVTQPDWIASLSEMTTWAMGMVRNYLGMAGVSAVLYYLVTNR